MAYYIKKCIDKILEYFKTSVLTATLGYKEIRKFCFKYSKDLTTVANITSIGWHQKFF